MTVTRSRYRPPDTFHTRFTPTRGMDATATAGDVLTRGRVVEDYQAEWDGTFVSILALPEPGSPRYLVIAQPQPVSKGMLPDVSPRATTARLGRYEDWEAAAEDWRWAYAALVPSWGYPLAYTTLRDADGELVAELVAAKRLRAPTCVDEWYAVVTHFSGPGPGHGVHHEPSYDEAMEAWCGTAEQWAVEELDPEDTPLARLLAARLRMEVAQVRATWAAGACGAELRSLCGDSEYLDGWDREDLAGVLDVSRTQLHKVLAGRAWQLPDGVE